MWMKGQQQDNAMVPEGVVVAEILKLQENVGLQQCDRLHEFLHKSSVL